MSDSANSKSLAFTATDPAADAARDAQDSHSLLAAATLVTGSPLGRCKLPPLATLGAVGLMSHGLMSHDAQAEDPEPLDEEFLDYLLQLEGEDEDWTLFDSQEPEPTAPATAAKPAPAQDAAATAKVPVGKPTQATAPTTQTPARTGAQSGVKR